MNWGAPEGVNIATPNASASALDKIRRTLQSGNAIWLLGQLRPLPVDYVPPTMPPAPLGPQKWFASPYLLVWQDELAVLLREHAVRAGQIMAPLPGGATTQENVYLTSFTGWR